MYAVSTPEITAKLQAYMLLYLQVTVPVFTDFFETHHDNGRSICAIGESGDF